MKPAEQGELAFSHSPSPLFLKPVAQDCEQSPRPLLKKLNGQGWVDKMHALRPLSLKFGAHG